MAHYMIEVGYTPQAWSTQIDQQSNVVERITPAIKATKGKIECIYYAFGDSDLVAIVEWPTPEEAAAFALTVTSSGALRSYKTTALLTVEQGVATMKRAAEVRNKYTPPLTVNLTEGKTAARR